jgi:hypothetical protein
VQSQRRQGRAALGVPPLEDLKLARQFVNWWIDNRQVPYGDFGGGISDDTDLTQQWPGLALMGVDPDKINASLRAVRRGLQERHDRQWLELYHQRRVARL